MAEGIRQHSERAQRGIDRVEIFDLVIEIAFGRRIKLRRPLALHQDLQKQREEIEIFLGGRKRKGIDFEILGREAHAHVGAAKQLRQAFKASAQVEDEGVRRILLELVIRKFSKNDLPAPVRPRIMVCATSR